MEEVEVTAGFLKERGAEFALLHCNSTYPAAFEDINLRFMDRLRRFDVPVGYSGHERGIAISSMTRAFLEHCPGPTIGITGSSGKTTTIRILLGAMSAGYVVNPVNLLSGPEQMRYVLDHSDCSLVFASPDRVAGVRALVVPGSGLSKVAKRRYRRRMLAILAMPFLLGLGVGLLFAVVVSVATPLPLVVSSATSSETFVG